MDDTPEFGHGLIVALLLHLNNDDSLGSVEEIFKDIYTAKKWLESERYYFVRNDGFRDIYVHKTAPGSYALVTWAVKSIITQK